MSTRSWKTKPSNGMDEWIHHQDLFTTWNDIDTPTQEPILKIEGPEKHGKTFLSHPCNRHSHHEAPANRSFQVSNNPPNVPLTTTSIAYYYFGKDGSDQKDETTLQDAIAIIIWQLVQSDYVYRQFVTEAYDPNGSPLQKQSLWELLKPRESSRFFIVLDGIDHSTEKTARGLPDFLPNLQPETDTSRRIRGLLSGTSQSLDCARNFGKTIDLRFAKEAKHDFELFTKHFLYDQSQIVQIGSHTTQVVSQPPDQALNILLSMQTNVKTFDAAQDSDIPTGIRNYDFIEFLLGKINDNLWSTEKVRELAEKLSTGGKFALVQYQLEHASQVLGKEEIQDLNKILPWLALPCNAWLELQMVEDIVEIAGREPPRLIVRKTYISEKFNDLMKLEGDVQISVTSSHPAGYFTEKFQMTADQTVTEENGRSRRDGQPDDELHPSEISMVKNLLKSVCGDELYKKFGFVQFFNEKEEPLRRGIYFHPIQGHIHIITTCLKAICHTETDDYQSLFQYTAWRLPWHLSQIDPEMLSDGQIAAMAKVMPLLCQFLDDDHVIERWFRVDWLHTLRDSWFSADNDEDFISKWFNDPKIARYRDPEVEISAKQSPMCGTRPVSSRNLQHLQSGIGSRGMIRSGSTSKTHTGGSKTSLTDEEVATIEEAKGSVSYIEQAEAWACNNVEFPADTWRNPQWESRTAETFGFYGHHSEATDRYESVFLFSVDLEFAKSHMKSYANAASKRDGRYERVLQVLEPLIEQFKSSDPFEGENLEKWLEIIHGMCRIYNDAGRVYDAATIGKYGPELSPRNLRIIATLVDWLFLRKKFEAIMKALDFLTPEELTTLLEKYGTINSIQQIAVAASRADSSSFIETCQRALPSPGELRSTDAFLCLCYSLVLAWDSRLGDDWEKVMTLWQNLLRLDYRDGGHSKIQSYAGQLLACTYLQLAVERDQEQISKQDQETYFFYRHRGLEPAGLIEEGESFFLARFHHLRQRDDLARATLERNIYRAKPMRKRLFEPARNLMSNSLTGLVWFKCLRRTPN
ncbi:hypothetical protein IWX90DRAFT_507586 [Phyllosticta citrichinensis]|uniref:Nephrocystin 3-like N-terminal domain-containing protein n=1 Tax=Phyllosticta citrichinensis TaxID=1130410 RepID=A0ABR1XKF5_9PEZI